jgi:hypothetical protein
VQRMRDNLDITKIVALSLSIGAYMRRLTTSAIDPMCDIRRYIRSVQRNRDMFFVSLRIANLLILEGVCNIFIVAIVCSRQVGTVIVITSPPRPYRRFWKETAASSVHGSDTGTILLSNPGNQAPILPQPAEHASISIPSSVAVLSRGLRFIHGTTAIPSCGRASNLGGVLPCPRTLRGIIIIASSSIHHPRQHRYHLHHS